MVCEERGNMNYVGGIVTNSITIREGIHDRGMRRRNVVDITSISWHCRYRCCLVKALSVNRYYWTRYDRWRALEGGMLWRNGRPLAAPSRVALSLDGRYSSSHRVVRPGVLSTNYVSFDNGRRGDRGYCVHTCCVHFFGQTDFPSVRHDDYRT